MRFLMTLGTAVCAYISIILTSHPELPSSQSLTPAQVLATCDTGDLLFFTNKKAATWFKAANPITHISVIVRDASGRPLSVETHADVDGPPNYEGDGINAYPLEVRLAQNGITTDLHLVKMTGPRVADNLADALLASLPSLRAQYMYRYTYIRDEVMCRATFGGYDVSKEMHCANFASLVLQKLGIAHLGQRLDCVRPLDVAWLKLLEGRSYVKKSPIAN